MREILFRGQTRRKGEKVQLDGSPVGSNWVYGGIFPNNNGGDFAIIYQQEPEIHKFPVYADTVGQYTGLTDKNKAKIFEGDIVRCYDSYDKFIAVVEFGNPNSAYNWGFQLKPITKTDFCTDILLWVEMEETGAFIEVIGNVHDNLELIGGEPE